MSCNVGTVSESDGLDEFAGVKFPGRILGNDELERRRKFKGKRVEIVFGGQGFTEGIKQGDVWIGGV